MTTLRLILGDQLNENHSWFEAPSKKILYVMMEVKSETSYVNHHIQKILGFFGAMRSFADRLNTLGHQVFYIKLDDPKNQHSFTKNLKWLVTENQIEKVQYLLPDEYRLDLEFAALKKELRIPVESFDTEHFLTKRTMVAEMFEGKKTYLMESFYRVMRKKFNILMDGDRPLNGQWNYDSENRKKLDPKVKVPKPLLFSHDLSDIYQILREQNVKTIGSVDPKNFIWPLTRAEALEGLNHFLKYCLPNFGTYQDAMVPDEPWLFHSRISFSLNLKLLSPLEVINAAIKEWQSREQEITYSQIEGFVRQILGWREYVRGIYWAKMPGYEKENFFNHSRKLPSFFWTGETKMHCISQTVKQSLEFSYAHHIQRLMVTGNFALLAGIDPNEVDQWYLGIYLDAIQWVEITNTRGMSQYADGGVLATKPYVSSANYIDKMSGYCSGCFYDKKEKVGEKACPFNSLYWDFFTRNENLLRGNPRIAISYKILDKMKELPSLIQQAKVYLENIENL
jgi:deoxyribodipyrimidine photolyase-related protein